MAQCHHTETAYSASKMAVVGLMKSLAVELGWHLIRVNALSPDGIATPMVVYVFGKMAEDMTVERGYYSYRG
ncbi:Short chain aldehyde dehydrogenase 1 [Linum perenne]